MIDPWTCEHGRLHAHEAPCCCQVVDMSDSGDVDWAALWTAFIHPDAPRWDQLDAASRGMFQVNYYAHVLPTLNRIAWAVEAFDHQQKAARN